MAVIATGQGFALKNFFCCLLGTVSATLGGLTASALAVEVIASPTETTVEANTEAKPTGLAAVVSPVAPELAVSSGLLEVESDQADPTVATPESADAVLAQVASVSELSDVAPGDWAYTADQRRGDNAHEAGQNMLKRCKNGLCDRRHRF